MLNADDIILLLIIETYIIVFIRQPQRTRRVIQRDDFVVCVYDNMNILFYTFLRISFIFFFFVVPSQIVRFFHTDPIVFLYI